MKPRDAEKLLGGHAAGILTEEEKRRLYAAALDHQQLFDALVDEEGLRELLADPESRKQLLALLSETKGKAPIKLWRRPAALGLAASLLLMVTTSLVLWQRERPIPPSFMPREKTAESKPAPTAPVTPEPGEGKPLLKRSASQVASSKAPVISEDSAVSAGAPAPVAQAPNKVLEAPPAMIYPPKMVRAEAASAERKLPPADSSKAAAAVEVVAARETMNKTEAMTRASEERLDQLPQNRTLAGAASLTPGVTGGGLQALGKSSAKKSPAAPLPPPSYVVEPLESGALRLTVTWSAGRHLYLLRRSDSGITALAPLRSATEAGRTLSTFEFFLGPEEHLDLYLLPQSVPDPKSLPAEGPVEGYRKRVQ